MNNIKILYEEYCKKIDEQPVSSINQDQKELIKHILKNAKEDEIDNWYRFLIKNIKLGFVFDEAPETIHNLVALIQKDEIRSFENHGGVKHKLIIGENYDALKNLLITHKNKVDVIYIDPPYNTEASSSDGNDYKEDVKSSKFIYRDKFSREGWLNMINERLKLAKELLADDGVIFVSIDDSEQAYLKVLMDDIFGEENFVSNLIWNSVNSVLKQSKLIRKDHEYILIYAKKIKDLRFKRFENNTIFTNIDNDPKGEWISTNAASPNQKSNNNRFKIKLPNGEFCERNWKFNYDDYLNGKVALYFKGGNVPRLKVYKSEYELNTKIQSSILFEKGSITTAKRQIFGILNDDLFSTPKPLEMIKHLLNLSINKQATILDFFGGSGTTGHAVMELNQEDGGNRQFILCTNNENQIADKVTYERLYRVINGIGTNQEEFEWKYSKDLKSLKNNNLDVFEIKYYDTKISKNIDKLKQEIKTQISLLSDNQINLSDEKDILRKLSSLRPQKVNKEEN